MYDQEHGIVVIFPVYELVGQMVHDYAAKMYEEARILRMGPITMVCG